MNLISTTSAPVGKVRAAIEDFADDADGCGTIKVLGDCLGIVARVTGNEPASLGLHPAVYFYSDKGRHLPDLLLGMLLVIRNRIQNNDGVFFKRFTTARELMEQTLISKKNLVTQAMQIARSKTRFERAADLFNFLVEECSAGKLPSDEEIVCDSSECAIKNLGCYAAIIRYKVLQRNQVADLPSRLAEVGNEMPDL